MTAFATTSVTEHRGLDAFERLEPRWRALERDVRARPFQTYDWARTWLRHYGVGAEPRVVEFREPAGLLPLICRRRAGVRVLSLLGDGVSDYLGPLGDDKAALAAHLAEWLSETRSHIDLIHLRSVALAETDLRGVMETLGGRPIHRVYERCPVIDTRGSWEDYLKTRKRKFRANLKRAVRRVGEQGGVKVERTVADAALFEEMIEVERESWKWTDGLAYLKPALGRGFLRELLLESGVEHELWTCRIDRSLAGFAVVLPSAGVRHYYLPSFRSHFSDVGSFLLGEIVRESFSSPYEELDFLRGDEGYKLAWATHQNAVHEIVAAGRSPLGPLAREVLRARWMVARSDRLRALRTRIRVLGWS